MSYQRLMLWDSRRTALNLFKVSHARFSAHTLFFTARRYSKARTVHDVLSNNFVRLHVFC